MRLPDDIDSCASLAGDLLATAEALSVRAENDAARALARDTAELGRALAEFADCVRWLRHEYGDIGPWDSGVPDDDPQAHRAATEIGKARSRLRRAAVTTRRGAGR